jgi:hypothetical protein
MVHAATLGITISLPASPPQRVLCYEWVRPWRLSERTARAAVKSSTRQGSTRLTQAPGSRLNKLFSRRPHQLSAISHAAPPPARLHARRSPDGARRRLRTVVVSVLIVSRFTVLSFYPSAAFPFYLFDRVDRFEGFDFTVLLLLPL